MPIKIRRTADALRTAAAVTALSLAVAVYAQTAAASAEAPTTYYVGPGGNDGGACTSAAAPCGTLQGAVNKAASGDTIQIAAGTYTFSVDGCPGNNMNAVVCISEKNLTLRGAGASNTFIDGQQAHRGVAVLGGGVKPAVTMENLAIRNSKGGPFGAEPRDAFGGGMLVNFGSATLRNMQFVSNQTVGNPSGDRGGKGSGGGLAILSSPGANTLQNIVFDGNQALGATGPTRGGEAQGGALFAFQSQISASSLTVNNNTAKGGDSSGSGGTPDGQESDGLGGGLSFQVGSNVTLQSSTFRNNQARGGNAAQFGGNAFGGAIFGEQATLNLATLDVRENEAVGGNGVTGGVGGGGAVSHDSTNMTLDRSTLIDNNSVGGNGNTAGAGGGGGIYITRFIDTSASSSVINTIIANNTARQGSGASAGGGGGGIWVQGLPLNLTHVTLAQNSIGAGMLGQAMIVNNFGAPASSTTDLNYSIVANHSGGGAAIIVTSGNTLNLNRGLWVANSANTDTFNGAATINGGGSMLSTGSAGFVSPGAPNFNYHISNSSAAVNQATGSTTPNDIDGNSRPQGSAPDIGADEYYVFVPPANLRPYAYVPLAAR
jgi:hypothetical protein